jgi:hypothetical protein
VLAELGESHDALADVLAGSGDRAGERAARRESLAVRRRRADHAPDDPAALLGLVESYRHLVRTLRSHGADAEAADVFRQSRPPRARRAARLVAGLGNSAAAPTRSAEVMRALSRPGSVRQARGAVAECAARYEADRSPATAIELAEACLELAAKLDAPAGAMNAEIRELVRRAHHLYTGLRDSPGLIAEERELVSTLEAVGMLGTPRAESP